MKRSIFAFLVLLGALVISIASPLIYDHYVDDTECCSIGDAVDSVSVDWAVAQVMNPVFTDIDEVLVYQENQLEDRSIDSIFFSIPKETLIDISRVLIGRSSRATKFSIVEEYKKNYQSTYKYLATDPVMTTRMIGDTLKLPASKANDTLINGKHYKLIKETRSNE